MEARPGTGEQANAAALLFDLYGTLADTSAMAHAVAPIVADAQSLARAWRTHQLQISWLLSLMERYEDFDAVTAYALEVALAEAGVRAGADQRREVLVGLDRLALYDDAVPALGALAADGYTLGVLSNGSPRALESLLGAAGIRESFQHVISANEVRAFKPAPSVYRHAAARVGAPVDEVWLVSANPFDVAGAGAAGMRTVQLERVPSPTYPFADPPDRVIHSLLDLPAALAPAHTREVLR